jgi:hypothetical protein
MIHQPVTRYGYPITVVLLLTAILFVGGFVLATVVPEMARVIGSGPVAPLGAPTPSPSPTAPAPMSFAPSRIVMAPGADCGGCHLDPSGGITTRPIPMLAHPLEGWRDCTACHADDRLVETAPGHTGIHRSDCLACHKVPNVEGSAPPRPHHLPTTGTCVSCHGKEAPLPTDMTGRTNCWICHSGTEFENLFDGSTGASSPEPGDTPGG